MTDLIERELDLPATPAEVWTAITDPVWLRRWLAEEVRLQLTPGGEACFTVDGESRTGWVEEVRPPAGDRSGRLAFWWQAADAPASRVELELIELSPGTRLRVSEARPLELLDLVGIPVRGDGRSHHGPALLAA